MRVTYLHLGSEDDAFYGKMVSFMRHGARSLGIDLEAIPCHRDEQRIREEGRAVLERAGKPDYFLIPNHKGLALDLVPQATAAGIRVFLVNEGLLVAEKATLGQPGEKHPLWLGEIVPDERLYGLSLAEALVQRARERGLTAADGTIHAIGLTGGFNFASISRNAGLRAAVARQSDVQLADALPAHWDRQKARELTAEALDADDELTVVWSASDLMARGAIDAIEAAGRTPGRDVLVGGVDWAPFAPDLVRTGALSVSAGGHFMDGAWALVILFDHHRGADVAPIQARTAPALLTAESLDRYSVFFEPDRWSAVDFSRFSRSRHPELRAYDFSIDAVVHAIG